MKKKSLLKFIDVFLSVVVIFMLMKNFKELRGLKDKEVKENA